MPATQDKTAILFFSRSAAKEAREKHFCKGQNSAANKRAAQLLISQTLETVKSTGFTLFRSWKLELQNVGFEEKLFEAFQKIYRLGFQNVIVVGNDSPGLKAQHLFQAERALQKQSAVIGPTQKGGAYLIGLKRGRLNKRDFEALPWQTPQLFEALKHLLEQNDISVQLLPSLGEINNPSDLKVIAKRAASLFRSLQFLWLPSFWMSGIQCHPPLEKLQLAQTRRGPPLV